MLKLEKILKCVSDYMKAFEILWYLATLPQMPIMCGFGILKENLQQVFFLYNCVLWDFYLAITGFRVVCHLETYRMWSSQETMVYLLRICLPYVYMPRNEPTAVMVYQIILRDLTISILFEYIYKIMEVLDIMSMLSSASIYIKLYDWIKPWN